MTQWRDNQAKRFASKPPLSQYASMFTTHYYTYRSTSPGASHTTFLAESKVWTGWCGRGVAVAPTGHAASWTGLV